MTFDFLRCKINLSPLRGVVIACETLVKSYLHTDINSLISTCKHKIMKIEKILMEDFLCFTVGIKTEYWHCGFRINLIVMNGTVVYVWVIGRE